MLNKILQDLLHFTFVYFSFVSSECSGIYSFRPCCNGENWDQRLQKCSKCPDGHYGVNCSLACDIPYYGYRCSTGKCACNRISCHISTACHKTRGKDIYGKKSKTTPGHNETNRTSVKTKTDAMVGKRSTKTSKLSSKYMQQKINRLSPSPSLTEASATVPRNKTEFVKENILFPYILGSITLVPLLFAIAICSYKHVPHRCGDKPSQHVEIHLEHDYEQTDVIYVNSGCCEHYDIIQQNVHQVLFPTESEASYESLKSLFSPEIEDQNYDDVANVIKP